MGCVLALCLPFDVKKSRWVTPLSEASVASRGRRRLPRRRGRRLPPSGTSYKSGQMCPDLFKRRNRPRTSPTPPTTSWHLQAQAPSPAICPRTFLSAEIGRGRRRCLKRRQGRPGSPGGREKHPRPLPDVTADSPAGLSVVRSLKVSQKSPQSHKSNRFFQ